MCIRDRNINIGYTARDELGELSENIRTTEQTLNSYVAEIRRGLGALGKGELKYHTEVKFAGDFAKVREGMEMCIRDRFVKGFGGIIKEAKEKISMLNEASPEDMDKIIFYRSVILTSEGIIRFANRYAEAAELMAKEERDEKRREELLNIAANCRKVPENPPETFYEAIQFVWFTQIGGILSENPLSLNPGRFDQYMNCLLYTSRCV